MRARMIVDAKIVNADPEHPVASYSAGQELEGAEAEYQVALGHAEALPEPEQEAKPKAAKADSDEKKAK